VVFDHALAELLDLGVGRLAGGELAELDLAEAAPRGVLDEFLVGRGQLRLFRRVGSDRDALWSTVPRTR
jgi:hypothetical protein